MDIRYEIRVRGHLSPEWTAVFKGMEITCLSNGDTALTGFSPDQAALYGLLLRLRDLGLTLISINPINLLGDNMSNLVLVTGATGKIGKEVVKQLVAKGARVRAFIHSRQNADALQEPGVEIVLGDLGQPATVQAALIGIEKLFLLSPMDPRLATWENSMIEAARQAGVQQIVYLSGTNACVDSPLLFNRLHGQSEAQLKDTGLAYTIIRPDALMQNVLTYASTISTQSVFYAPFPDSKMGMVDCRDIAAVAVATLTETGHEGKTYNVTGAEALSANQVAQKLSIGLGKNVQCIELKPEQYQMGLTAAGMPEWLVNYLVGVAEYYASIKDVGITKVVEEIAHKPPVSFDQFVRDYALAFKMSDYLETK